MSYINRTIESALYRVLQTGKSVLLLGPRQTGKTTLLKRIEAAMTISLLDPKERLRYERDPGILADEIKAIAESASQKPLVIIDEIQKAPLMMDVLQYLIDEGVAQFILTGSSARKLKRVPTMNLLPGRLIPLTLDALSVVEIPTLPVLEDLLFYGSLPEIITTVSREEKEALLNAYVTLYLEEEIRMEAIVRRLDRFSRFLELAAVESGLTINYSKLSQLIGVSRTTIADYYQILEDCLIIQRIEPLVKSKTRHKLSKSNKYLFFDMGVRRLAANEGEQASLKTKGLLFEQFVGLELLKQTRQQKQKSRVLYWRDLDGPEVDWVVQTQDRLIPIEVKYTDSPREKDARHLHTFLAEYPEAKKAYIVCQAPKTMKLSDKVYAIPWQNITRVFEP